MRQLQLTKGKVALVDDEDFERLDRFQWHAVVLNTGKLWYARTTLKLPDGEIFICPLHWAVLEIRLKKGLVVDHIDGDGLNNQRSNLRVVLQRQNTQNKHKIYSSKYPGVSLQKSTGKWIAHIKIGEVVKHLGTFKTEEEAFERYKQLVALCGQSVILDKGD